MLVAPSFFHCFHCRKASIQICPFPLISTLSLYHLSISFTLQLSSNSSLNSRPLKLWVLNALDIQTDSLLTLHSSSSHPEGKKRTNWLDISSAFSFIFAARLVPAIFAEEDDQDGDNDNNDKKDAGEGDAEEKRQRIVKGRGLAAVALIALKSSMEKAVDVLDRASHNDDEDGERGNERNGGRRREEQQQMAMLIASESIRARCRLCANSRLTLLRLYSFSSLTLHSIPHAGFSGSGARAECGPRLFGNSE